MRDFTQKLKIKILGHVTSSIFSNKKKIIVYCSFKKTLSPLYGPDVHLSGVIWGQRDAQRAKLCEKVHKPSLGVNVINFELNVFNASI